MASEQFIFSLYKTSGGRYFVLRTVRAAFRNASQFEENDSWELESAQRAKLLEYAEERFGQRDFRLIGELHGYPTGDVFYAESGQLQVPVYYMQTAHGTPWIVFGSADSEAAFLAELSEDDDLQALGPTGQPTRIDAAFVTLNDSRKH